MLLLGAALLTGVEAQAQTTPKHPTTTEIPAPPGYVVVSGAGTQENPYRVVEKLDGEAQGEIFRYWTYEDDPHPIYYTGGSGSWGWWYLKL